MPNGTRRARQNYTSHEAASLMQVHPASVNNWIKNERLQAYRTPGGHRRIEPKALVAFLVKWQMPIPKELEDLVSRRVLWVDPDGNARRSLERKFSKVAPSRVEFRMCVSGVKALVMCGTFLPDVVVLDGRIKDLGRADMLNALLNHAETSATKVCFVDLNPTDAFRAQANADGIFECLSRSDDPMRVLDI